MRFCPECGTERVGGSFCGNCGFKFPVENEFACPECGTKRLEGLFCGKCGHRFSTPGISATQVNTTASVYGVPEDPDNDRMERFYENDIQTEQTSASKEVFEEQNDLLERLVYGKGFSKASHCNNCGEPKPKTRKTCKLCEAEL
jgi:hypothetical protein